MARERVRFERPPVVEVVCGVLFDSQKLPLQTPHYGLFWEGIRGQFPHASDNAPLDPSIEPTDQGPATVQLQLGFLPPLRRTWFSSADGHRLIQLQEDRFHYNWKRSAESDPYPSYDQIVEDFKNYLRKFTEFVGHEKIGTLQFRQFEMSYINHIIPDKAGTALNYGDVLVDHFCSSGKDRFLPDAELINWMTSYRLPHSQGRLHIAARTALRPEDQRALLRLDLTARGLPPQADSAESLSRWFDLAHEWITHGFADCTSPDLHKTWGRVS